MMHWLEIDDEGLVREGNIDDSNASAKGSIFTGRAIETFEQSPTKSVSTWQDGKRHGETTEFF